VTAPIFGLKKIYVIDSAEKMTEQAQNALLKILEEPPAYAMIMLMCNNILSMLSTIKSRVIRIDFSRNTGEEIIQKYEQLCVAQYKKPDESKSELLCSYADGIMGRVYEFLDSDALDEKRRAIFNCMKGLLNKEIDAKLKMTDIIGNKGSNYEFTLFTMMSFLRDIMISSRFGRKAVLQNPDFKEEISVVGRDVGYYRAVKCLEIVDDCYKKLCRNAAPDITVDCMLIHLRES
jgi:DNA polymerase-3 subunit delta'